MDQHTVTFRPGGQTAKVSDCTTILEAATQAGIHIPNSCGGEGSCGKCKVIVHSGEVFAPETPTLDAEKRAAGYVLACQAMVEDDLIVECPSQTDRPEILIGRVDTGEDSEENLPDVPIEHVSREIDTRTHDIPLVVSLNLYLPKPSVDDNLDDLSRLYREIRQQLPLHHLNISLEMLRDLGQRLRKSDWRVNALIGQCNGTAPILSLDKLDAGDDASPPYYGLAVDVGTTTVVCHLIRLENGESVDVAARLNSQGAYGDDVISRILYTTNHGAGLKTLQDAIVTDINELIQEMCARQGIHEADIVAASIAGNATMTHLLLGIDPSHIRQEPYVATANFMPVIEGRDIGLAVRPNALLHSAPGVASYVGGDTTAGVLACGMANKSELSLFIDIGTNGEIVLGNSEWLICCCCSCGPAFEGSGVRFGMRAAQGAIQRAHIRLPEIDVETIGNVPPRGICGTGMIDLLAEMLKAGVLDRSGRFQKDSCPSRFREGEDGCEFILTPATISGDTEIVLTQADVNTLLRSKAAVYAGVSVLVEQMGIAWEDIAQIYVAGGFGNHLDITKSIQIGLLPDLPVEKYQFIGNSSVTGARQLLLSSQARRFVTEIAKKMTYLELSANNMFMEHFMSAMFLPHTDLSRFPSVMLI